MTPPRPRPRVLALLLAGGAGSRLGVLTDDRAKPSLPFGGNHRLIDFPLSSCRRSDIGDVWVIEQHNPHSLIDHLANGRPWDLDRTVGGFRVLHPFTDEDGGEWHGGNAHAIHTHTGFIRASGSTHVLVLSADHVYALDYRDVVDGHVAAGPDVAVTIVTTEVESEASRHAVVELDGDRVTGFVSKPDEPASSTVATEVFLYDTDVLLDTLADLADEHGPDGLGDFGEHLLPRLVDAGRARAHAQPGYWRDVGTVESYWQGHADLLGAEPVLRLDAPGWDLFGGAPVGTAVRLPPDSSVTDSLLGPGAQVAGLVERSVVGARVVVEAGATVTDSVLMDDVVVRAGGVVERAVVADRVVVARGGRVGQTSGPISVVAAGTQVADGEHHIGEPD